MHRVSQGTQDILLNFPTELRPRKGFYRAKPKFHWSMRFMRRLLHRNLEAVAGLVGNMAGLRFSYAHKLVQTHPDGKKQLILLT